MGAKLKAVRTELILLCVAAVFLCALLGLARRDRAAAAAAVSVVSAEALGPEEIDLALVNVNTAGKEELATLPGIGESLAERIIQEREENGPFAQVEDLLRVSGIGEKKLEELRDYVTLRETDEGAET